MGWLKKICKEVHRGTKRIEAQLERTHHQVDKQVSRTIHQIGKQMGRTLKQIEHLGQTVTDPKRLVKEVVGTVATLLLAPVLGPAAPIVGRALGDAIVDKCNGESVKFKHVLRDMAVMAATQIVGELANLPSTTTAQVVVQGTGNAAIAVATKQDPVRAFVVGAVRKGTAIYADTHQFTFWETTVTQFLASVAVSAAMRDSCVFEKPVQELVQSLTQKIIAIGQHELVRNRLIARNKQILDDVVSTKTQEQRTRFLQLGKKLEGSRGDWSFANLDTTETQEYHRLKTLLATDHADHTKRFDQLRANNYLVDTIAETCTRLFREAQVLACVSQTVADEEPSVQELLQRKNPSFIGTEAELVRTISTHTYTIGSLIGPNAEWDAQAEMIVENILKKQKDGTHLHTDFSFPNVSNASAPPSAKIHATPSSDMIHLALSTGDQDKQSSIAIGRSDIYDLSGMVSISEIRAVADNDLYNWVNHSEVTEQIGVCYATRQCVSGTAVNDTGRIKVTTEHHINSACVLPAAAGATIAIFGIPPILVVSGGVAVAVNN